MLCTDVLIGIFSFLSPLDVYSSSLVSRQWQIASTSSILWRRFGENLECAQADDWKKGVQRKILELKNTQYESLEKKFTALRFLRLHGWMKFEFIFSKAEAIFCRNLDKKPLLSVIADMITDEDATIRHEGIQHLRRITLLRRNDAQFFLYTTFIVYCEKNQENAALEFCSKYFIKLHLWNVPRAPYGQRDIITKAASRFLLHAVNMGNCSFVIRVIDLLSKKYPFVCTVGLLQRVSAHMSRRHPVNELCKSTIS